MNLTINRAYDDFKGKIYTAAALGVDFAEAHQSLAMITRTCETLIKFTRALRRGDLLKANTALGHHFIPKGASVRKSFANNFLEYHFGWEPLVRDIYDAADAVNNPIKTFEMARGKSTATYPVLNSKLNFGSTGSNTSYLYRYKCLQGGRVQSITNSTYHTLEQFGLINPAVILWELVPFSFVVDWFANVGDVLASYSDFAGMSLTDTYTFTRFHVDTFGHTFLNAGFTAIPGYKGNEYVGVGLSVKRDLGLVSPVFSVKRLKLPSKTRAVTALSLLTQIMKKK